MKNEVRVAYDSLASGYNLIYSDWQKSVEVQSKTIDRVIRKGHGAASKATVLDCSCGIGTQAIGMALIGYKVHATDLSPKSVEQARRNAKKMRASLTFGIADFRELEGKVKGRFDIVLSCDNSLPHLLTKKDLLLAAKSMKAKLNPKGICVVGIRDYDEILKRRPKGVVPNLMNDKRGERVYVQIWQWDKIKPTYRFSLFLLTKKGLRWKTHCVEAKYRAWSRKELSTLFLDAGFSGIHWLMPKDSGFIQPLAIAKV